MDKLKKALNNLFKHIIDSFKYVIAGVFKILGRIIWFFLKPIFKPANKRAKARLGVLAIVIFGCLAFLYNFPSGFNRAADRLNNWKSNVANSDNLVFKNNGFDQWLDKWQFPYFYTQKFRMGLDLKGGTHLVYQADLSNIDSGNYNSAMDGVRDVVERRINIFGVSEPIVQTSKVGGEWRLIVDLADVKDVKQAIKMIGETPLLEFKEEKTEEEIKEERKNKEQEINNSQDLNSKLQEKDSNNNQNKQSEAQIEALDKDGNPVDVDINAAPPVYIEPFKNTGLSGKYLKRADLVFDPQTSEPQVSLEFNSEGKDMFSDITQRNVGKRVAIYLDGMPISAPNVNEPILNGRAVIQGDFTIEDAKQLAQRLNAGALPVPIKLIQQNTIGATLGEASLQKSMKAGMIGLLAVVIFMIVYYRLAGLLAGIALAAYVIVSLAIFKFIPVTLTLSGIAGFILSFGMAVDANVLVFERIKEEMHLGKSLETSIAEGFTRAWPSIRDGNASTLITCLVLYTFASSSVKGFALTLGIGIIVSMFSAIIITRKLMDYAILSKITGWTKKIKFLWKAGI